MKKNLYLIVLVCALVFTGDLSADNQSIDKVNVSRHDIVEIYTTSWCPYCKKAEAFLKANGINYVNFDIEKDKAAARRKKQLDSRGGVPLAVIDGQTIYGFSERTYRTALNLD